MHELCLPVARLRRLAIGTVGVGACLQLPGAQPLYLCVPPKALSNACPRGTIDGAQLCITCQTRKHGHWHLIGWRLDRNAGAEWNTGKHPAEYLATGRRIRSGAAIHLASAAVRCHS